jgi:hypothetical protein
MTASFVNVHGAFIGPDQDLARSLSSLDVFASGLLWRHPENGCGDLQRRAAPSSLTGPAHTDHSQHRQKAIQYP